MCNFMYVGNSSRLTHKPNSFLQQIIQKERNRANTIFKYPKYDININCYNKRKNYHSRSQVIKCFYSNPVDVDGIDNNLEMAEQL